MKRKRKAVKSKDKLAAALAALMPQSERDILRGARAPADVVLARFQFHHVIPHCAPFNGSDAWWNLDAMPKKAHRARSKGLGSDTSVIAKTKRLRAAPQAVAGKPKPARVRIDASGPRRCTTGRPTKAWGIPGLRKKINGEVVRR